MSTQTVIANLQTSRTGRTLATAWVCALVVTLAACAASNTTRVADGPPDFEALEQRFIETGEIPDLLNPPADDSEQLSLAEHLLDLNSAEGLALLESASATADFAALDSHFEAQIYRSYCGVASSVVALQALGYAVEQAEFFDEAAAAVAPQHQILFHGMTLDTLGALIEARGALVEVGHAADLTLDAFRALASENLSRSDDFLIVNYSRTGVGQERWGHISPLGAYDAASDRFLILDVAAYKYPPVWVDAERLFSAMNEVDSDSGLSRGFVVVRPGTATSVPRQ